MSGRGLSPSGLVIKRLRSAFSVGRLLIEYRKVFTASMLDARTSTGPGLIVAKVAPVCRTDVRERPAGATGASRSRRSVGGEHGAKVDDLESLVTSSV
jgi:hypothetical protein